MTPPVKMLSFVRKIPKGIELIAAPVYLADPVLVKTALPSSLLQVLRVGEKNKFNPFSLDALAGFINGSDKGSSKAIDKFPMPLDKDG